jgi:hypothetical protein
MKEWKKSSLKAPVNDDNWEKEKKIVLSTLLQSKKQPQNNHH